MENQEQNIIEKCCNCGIFNQFLCGIVILFLISLVVWFGAGALNKIKEGKYIGQEIESRNTITVSGTGEIYTKPDLAVVNFSVVTEKKTVAEAMSENTKKMNTVIGSIKSQGVEEKDLRTTNFSIYPRYEYQKETECLYYPCPEKRVLAGYTVSQTLNVKMRDMAKIGDIIQEATDAGANEAGSLQFTVEEEEEFEKQAREEAIEEAKTKAKELASQLGVKLIRITNFSESGVTPIFMPSYYKEGASSMGGEDSLQIETGENKIESTVSIIYEIN